MKQKKRSPASPIAFVLVLALLFSMFTPVAVYAGTSKDVTHLLTGPGGTGDPVLTVSQGGDPIDDTLNNTSPIAINVSFKVPVWGDYVVREDIETFTPEQIAEAKAYVVEKGDTAAFELGSAANFKIPVPASAELETADGTLVGNVTFVEEGGSIWAKITFNGEDEVFGEEDESGGEPYNNVVCDLETTFILADGFGGDDWGDHTVTILEKDYTVHIPTHPRHRIYDVEKGRAEPV